MEQTKTGTVGARGKRAFTLVEVLVAASVSALFMTAAALAYSAVVSGQQEMHSYGRVEVGASNLQAFYGSDAPTDGSGSVLSYRNMPWAPNYAKAAELEILRDVFWEDVSSATAVFCLPRVGINDYHPSTIDIPLTIDARTIDTSDRFRQLIEPLAPGVFTPFRGTAPASSPNGTVFVLQLSPSKNSLSVRASYDIDFVPTSTPAGTYVSIRRYEGSTVTIPYEIFYPAGDGSQSFAPLFVAFERSGRLINSDAFDTFKVANERPFQFMWWPDPVDKHLEPMPHGPVAAEVTGSARATYWNQSGRTAFFFVIPTFPAL